MTTSQGGRGDPARLAVYADETLGRYGFVEKPWFQPSERLAAFLTEAGRRELAFDRCSAPPATDAELAWFHTPAHVAWVTERCRSDRGSVDRAPEPVVARARVLLAAIAAVGVATEASIAETVAELGSLDAWAPLLQSDGLVTWDGASVALTDAGHAFLADPQASLGGPTFARAAVERAARHICGAVVDAVRRIQAGEIRSAFVPIAGFHHAHRAEARMYCLYNDAGLAVEAALRAVDGPVAYIDVDIHRGDGVYEAFAEQPRVVIADVYQREGVARGEVVETEFVGRGAGEGAKRALGIGPLDDAAYLAAFEGLEAFVRARRPAFVVFEAGVDGLATDPMSDQDLTPAVFREVARRVKALADECAGGRLLVLGGGGYEITGLAAGWSAVVEGLTTA
ncbi:MAG: hypothetical protein H6737_14085 [Alphaproteobacteria bacterium]|nr:hypothetical protein [Alphaproteobacteria bacterium]